MGTYNDIIINRSNEILYNKGLTSTSIEEIIIHCGVSRRTFYKNFRNKKDIICAVLERRSGLFCDAIHEATAPCTSQREIIMSIFHALTEWHERFGFHGCLFQAAFSQYGHDSDKIFEISRSHKKQLQRILMNAFASVSTIQADIFANSILILMEGATALGNFGRPAEQIERAKDVAIQLLDDGRED